MLGSGLCDGVGWGQAIVYSGLNIETALRNQSQYCSYRVGLETDRSVASLILVSIIHSSDSHDFWS